MSLSPEEREREAERARIQTQTQLKTAWGIQKKLLLFGCVVPVGLIFLLMLIGMAA